MPSQTVWTRPQSAACQSLHIYIRKFRPAASLPQVSRPPGFVRTRSQRFSGKQWQCGEARSLPRFSGRRRQSGEARSFPRFSGRRQTDKTRLARQSLHIYIRKPLPNANQRPPGFVRTRSQRRTIGQRCGENASARHASLLFPAVRSSALIPPLFRQAAANRQNAPRPSIASYL